MINGLDLFSGIGGITLALSPWVRPIAYCENDRYAQSVLLSRMASGELPLAPIWDDIRTLRLGKFGSSGNIDIIYGGFPCQDISVAGNGKGLAGERSGLFFEIARLVDEIRPTFVFLENVPPITTRGLGEVAAAFTRLRYDCRWGMLSAYDVGAAHLRERWFALAYSNSKTLRQQQGRWCRESGKKSALNPPDGDAWLAPWTPERAAQSRISRAGNGLPFAVDRDRALGNAVVPLQAREAFERLAGLK